MPVAIANAGRIRTNTPAENAYNTLRQSSNDIALRQLRLSTGKRINAASDDVSGYITSRALQSRVGSLRAALTAVGDARSVANIAQDSLANISSIMDNIKSTISQAASGALGTDEKVALAQAAYRLAEQVQTVVDSTVFAGRAIIDASFSGDFVVGFRGDNTLLTLSMDLTTIGNPNFAYNINTRNNQNFAGVSSFSLFSLGQVTTSDLGIFNFANIAKTLTSISSALNNVNIMASYIGGVVNRMESQEDVLNSQITNYNGAISRISDADIAQEQLELIRSQFLQQTSLTSLAQANQNPQNFLQLIRG
jgi:flagellin